MKMPHALQRQIIKSKLPYAYESDDDDGEYYENKEDKSGHFESSIGDHEHKEDELVDLGGDDGENEAAQGGGELVFEHDQMNWAPRTVDVRKLGAGLANLRKKREEGMPSELLMSDTNIMAMRVPNFSYAGDPNYLRNQ